MDRKTAKAMWLRLVKERILRSPRGTRLSFSPKATEEVAEKLSKVRFARYGKMKEGTKYYRYAMKHFPHLVKLFEEERDA